MIYAIEAVGVGAVKFGMAKNPAARLNELQTGNPFELRLVAQVGWHNSNEGVLHTVFAPERLRGEWFRKTERVERFIEMMSEAEGQESFNACMGWLADEVRSEGFRDYLDCRYHRWTEKARRGLS